MGLKLALGAAELEIFLDSEVDLAPQYTELYELMITRSCGFGDRFPEVASE